MFLEPRRWQARDSHGRRLPDLTPSTATPCLKALARRAAAAAAAPRSNTTRPRSPTYNPLVTPPLRRRRRRRPLEVGATPRNALPSNCVSSGARLGRQGRRHARSAPKKPGQPLSVTPAPASLVNAAVLGAIRAGLRGVSVHPRTSRRREAAEHVARAGVVIGSRVPHQHEDSAAEDTGATMHHGPLDDPGTWMPPPHPLAERRGPLRSWTASAFDRLKVAQARHRVRNASNPCGANTPPTTAVAVLGDALRTARAAAARGTWVDAKLAELGEAPPGEEDGAGAGAGGGGEEEHTGSEEPYHALSGFPRRAAALLEESRAVRQRFARVSQAWGEGAAQQCGGGDSAASGARDVDDQRRDGTHDGCDHAVARGDDEGTRDGGSGGSGDACEPVRSLAYLQALDTPPDRTQRDVPFDRCLFQPDVVAALVSDSRKLREAWNQVRGRE